MNYTVPDAWKIPLWVAKLEGNAWPPIKRIISSDRFWLVIAALIVFNAVVMGVTADLELRSALDVYSGGPPIDGNVTRTLFFAELILTVAFLIELPLRMCALGSGILTSPDWKFNVLDMVLVMVSAFDVTMQSFTVSFGRLLRLLIVFTRTLWTLRPLHHTINLRTMLLAILASLGSWAVLLLGMMTFSFAGVLVQRP